MAEAGMRVIGYDPLAWDGARSAFRDKALVAESIDAALADAALVVVTTPDAPSALSRRRIFSAARSRSRSSIAGAASIQV